MALLKGTAVSAGIAQGSAYVVACGYRSAVPQRSIRPSEVDGERRRFDAAVAKAGAELAVLQEDVRERIGGSQAEIFAAQRLILVDGSLHDQVLRTLEEKRVNLEAAVSEVFGSAARDLEVVGGGTLQARAADVDDVRRRI